MGKQEPLAETAASEVPTRPGLDAASPLAPQLVPGDLLGSRYEVVRFLARGGMGEVYEANDLALGIAVALKTIRAELARHAPTLRRFKREVLLARSVSHPGVCRLYDFGRDAAKDLCFLSMELLAGETLRERIRARGRFTEEQALPLVRQAGEALDAAHQVGVVHRDFKSANVMLVGTGGEERALVTDFGLAQATLAGDDDETGSLGTVAGKLVGTPEYMSPEQVEGGALGPATDIYALGVVLFEMMTGTLPFAGPTRMATALLRLSGEVPSPRDRVAQIDPRWEAVIRRCLARDPRERFARSSDVARALAGESLETSPARTWSSRQGALPAEHGAFVGREAELEALQAGFGEGARLVTLVGRGGTGKTRLATRFGAATSETWPGGVWFCDLSEARNTDGIVAAVAGALEIPLGKDDPVLQLGRSLASRGRVLVILDNFEQVLEHAPETVGNWLGQTEEACFLATSRERLHLEGERVEELGPLDEEAAVELFVERAERQRPGFRLAGNEAHVREAVRQLEGLPLAIELASARLKVLSPAQLVERLVDRFRLLSGGERGRHATLAAAIDGSFEALARWEKAAFAQASVFEGGFTLEAAEAVLDLSGFPDAPWVVDVIQALVDKSLVRMQVPAGLDEPRFRMYVSLQEYAGRRLAGSDPGAARGAQERHGAYYARAGTPEAIEALSTHGGVSRQRRLAADLHNVIAACRRAVGRGDGPTAAATLAAGWGVLHMKGPFLLGAELGRQVLGLATLGPADQGHALRILADALRSAGRMDEAREHFVEALVIARAAGDRHFEGRVLGSLGMLHLDQGRMDEALRYNQDALAADREVGDRCGEGVVLANVSLSLHGQGRTEEALRLMQESLAIAREVGNRCSEGLVLCNLGNLCNEQGRMGEALQHLQEGLAIHREVGSRRFEGNVLGNLGVLHYEQGRMEEAVRHFQEALAIHRDVGNRRFVGSVLGNLGTLHREQGEMQQARERYEEALAIAREVGDRPTEAIHLDNLGSLHGDQGRTEEALRHFQEAVTVAREAGDRRIEGSFLGNLGLLHARQGRLEQARAALAAGETLLRAANDRFVLGKHLCQRGECEHLAGDLSAAHGYLCEAESIAGELAAGPDSDLCKEVAKLHAALDACTAPPCE